MSYCSPSLEGLRLVVLERGLLGDAVRIVEVESGQDVYTLQLGSPTTLAKCSSTEVLRLICLHFFVDNILFFCDLFEITYSVHTLTNNLLCMYTEITYSVCTLTNNLLCVYTDK